MESKGTACGARAAWRRVGGKLPDMCLLLEQQERLVVVGLRSVSCAM